MLRFSQNFNHVALFDGKIEGPVEEADVAGALFSHSNQVMPKIGIVKLQHKGMVGKIQIDKKYDKATDVTTLVLRIHHNGSKVECSVFSAMIESLNKISLYPATLRLREIEEAQKDYSSAIFMRAKEIYFKSFTSREVIDPISALTELVSQKPVISMGNITAGAGYMDAPQIIIVEGRRDVLKLGSAHITNVIGVGGLNVTSQDLQPLVKGKSLTLMFDGDKGGRAIETKVRAMVEKMSDVEIKYSVAVPEGLSVENIKIKELTELISKKKPIRSESET